MESGRAGSISIHTPHAGSDIQQPEDRGRRGISIHTPHAGSDLWHCQKKAACCYFNPHSPCGERPLLRTNSRAGSYFNPHSPCGERRYTYDLEGITMDISIHTPHAGSDEDIPDSEECPFYFNPHSPCGERRRVSFDHAADILISIHTPHAGSDAILPRFFLPLPLFQSTLPMRGATGLCMFPNQTLLYFNPHSPCGERLHFSVPVVSVRYFNPHSPCGERQFLNRQPQALKLISIHTPHAGSDDEFNNPSFFVCISIHTPHAGSDLRSWYPVSFVILFQSTLPMRGATAA